MKHAISAFFSGAGLLSAGAALAHGGHEAAVVQGDAHWLMQGDHLAVLGLVVLFAGLVVGLVGRRVIPARRAQRRQA